MYLQFALSHTSYETDSLALEHSFQFLITFSSVSVCACVCTQELMCHRAWVWSEENLQLSVLSSTVWIPEIRLRQSGLLPFPTEPSGQASDILLIHVFISQACTLSLLIGVTHLLMKCCSILYFHVYIETLQRRWLHFFLLSMSFPPSAEQKENPTLLRIFDISSV